MDPFVLVLFGGLAALVLALWLLGRLYPGSGLEQLGLKSARQIAETREALEAEDLEQLVAARNRRRQARGEAEVSAEEYELQVAREQGEQARRRREYRAAEAERRRDATEAEAELDQLLAATNARRRARGLEPRSREQAQSELGGQRPEPGPER